MKKTLLALALVAGFSYGASAQCTADSAHFTSTSYNYPDTFPCLTAGLAFTGTESIQIPSTADAHDFFSAAPAGSITATVDSARITSITGYPTGVTGTGPALNTWLHGGDIRCFQIAGTTTATPGDYTLTVTGDICAHAVIPVLGTQSTCQQNVNVSRFFTVKLTVCTPAGIQEVLKGVEMNVFPNPNQGSFNVTISADDRITGDINVLDALGRTIHNEALDVTGTKQIALDLGNVASGVYMLMINTANGKAVRQFTVK